LNDVLGRGPVAVDTALFIYLIEEHPRFLAAVRSLFESASRGRIVLVTSAVTLLEVLVVPFRAGNLPLAARYEALLTQSRGVQLVDLDRQQLRAAAQLRAAYRVRTPDALQIAAALTARCPAMVTNDRDFPRVAGLEIIQLGDHL
jgi:predicted nucleic acid-binding protein